VILGIGSIQGYPKFPRGNGGYQGYLMGLGNAMGYTNSISCSVVVCFPGVLTTGPPSKKVFFLGFGHQHGVFSNKVRI
jgi:hypothetical protein